MTPFPVNMGSDVPDSPEMQMGDGDQSKSRRGNRGRRRGRRSRRKRSQRSNGGNNGNGSGNGGGDDADSTLPENPEELAAESRPLGLLEVLNSGSGFIRLREAGYTPSRDDIYVSARLIQKFGLRTGDELMGVAGRAPRNGKSPPLAYLHRVNDRDPEELRRRPDFQRLSAMHPDDQLRIECGRTVRGEPDYTNRVIDLFCPFGKGQRALIVAPAKAGKTTVLQAVAEGIVTNNPECHLMILLVDERPEEVTEMEACGFGEVISSTFDRSADRHTQVAEMTLERARRRVEMGEDVVIILDSITRLARAHNTVEEGSGRTLSGGLDAQSLEKPKRFLGSARKIAPGPGRGLAHDHRHGAGGHRVAHGSGDLRGVQGNRKQRVGALPRAGRQADLPGDRPDRLGHPQGGASARRRRPLALQSHAPSARRRGPDGGDAGASEHHAQDEHQQRPHHLGAPTGLRSADQGEGGSFVSAESAAASLRAAALSPTIAASRARLLPNSRPWA